MMINEFRTIVRGLMWWASILIVCSFVFLLPLKSHQSLSVLVFQELKSRFLPEGVELVVTNPLSAFLAEMTISVSLSFIVSMPFLIYSMARYLSPAMFVRERRLVRRILIPSMILFLLGCAFAYFFIIPSTFKLLYPFANALGARPFFLLDEFVTTIMTFMIATGVLFLLPIFMILLSWIGLVSHYFWKENWRYALVLFLIVSAIITPDGTGITMLMLTLPFVILYATGSVVSKRIENYKLKI
ncbi:twin-arginine translocase subunit TatC [Candidatus Parcubacteria bacterium]|nr:twin-arginine translocase subunit TatC [Candidatus Parcubacteria bacterium]